jgi:hypothetical protein
LIKSQISSLPLFEATIREKDDFALQCYRSYLSRVYIQYVGRGNEEICDLIKGLIHLGDEAKQEDVRRVVLHMIKLVEKEREGYRHAYRV